MIHDCTELDKLKKAILKNKNWFEYFIKLCKEYYEKEPTGGSLHIVLEDGNLEHHNIHWCSGYAAGVEDNEGYEIADLMLGMTMPQKTRVWKKLEAARIKGE